MANVPGTSGRDGRERRHGVRVAGLLAVIVGMGFATTSMASASPLVPRQVDGLPGLLKPTASDGRAKFVGQQGAVLLGPGRRAPGLRPRWAMYWPIRIVTAPLPARRVPTPDRFTPGQGEELNVTIDGPGVVMDAVVVVGRGRFQRLFRNRRCCRRRWQPPQHYIPPFNLLPPNGSNTVPALRWWFVCYHLDPATRGRIAHRRKDRDRPGLPARNAATDHLHRAGQLQRRRPHEPHAHLRRRRGPRRPGADNGHPGGDRLYRGGAEHRDVPARIVSVVHPTECRHRRRDDRGERRGERDDQKRLRRTDATVGERAAREDRASRPRRCHAASQLHGPRVVR